MNNIKRNENIEILPNKNIIQDNIKYFKSGIGDNLDLLVDIQTDKDFYESFDLSSNVYGTYYKNDKKLSQVNFDYRLKTTGTYTEDERNGYVKFKLIAYPINKIKYTITKTAEKSINVNWYIEAKVGFYKYTGTKNGDVLVYDAVSKSIKSQIYTHSFQGPVDELNKIKILNTKVKDVMLPLIENDEEVKVSMTLGTGYFVHYYEVYSDYSFDSVDKYNHTLPKTWSLGSFGNIKVVGDRDITNLLNPDSYIYIYGYNDGQQFNLTKQIEKSYLFKDNLEHTLISKNDLTLGEKLRNISEELLDETDVDVLCNVTVDYIDKDITITVPFDKTKDIVMAGKCSVKLQSLNDTPLTYKFNDAMPQTDIIFTNILDNNIIDSSKKYFVELTILETSDNIYLLDTNDVFQKSVQNLVLEYPEENIYSKIQIEARYLTVTKSYEVIFPELNEKAWKGIVNGNSVNCSMDFTLPYINLPINLQNVKYEVLVSNISPVDAYVKTEFKLSTNTNISTTNEDTVTFSSNYTALNSNLVEEFITNYKFMGFNVSNKELEEKSITITEPTSNTSYVSYKVKLLSNNPNVVISNYNENIEFVDGLASINFNVIYDESLINNFHPRLHNGFYYINQNEYYLYSNEKGIADYIVDSTNKIKDGFAKYNIYVDFKQNFTVSNKNLTLNSYADFLNNEEHINIFNYDNVSKLLSTKPIIDTYYYTKYNDTQEYISNTLFLGTKVQSLTNITFDKVIANGSNIKVYIQTFNEATKTWNDFVLVNSGASLSSITPSSFIKYKIVFTNTSNYTTNHLLETYSCCLDYENEINKNESSNIKIYQNRIECDDPLKPGIFISNTYDYGISVAYSIEAYATTGTKVYVASSNTDTNPNNFVEVNNTTVINGRYIKYKIELINQKVYQIFKSIDTFLLSAANIAKIGNINITYNTTEETKIINRNISTLIPFDNTWQTVTSNLLNDLKSDIYDLGFTESDVKSVLVTNKNTEETEIQYTNSITTSIKVRSLSTVYDTDFYSDFISLKDNSLLISPVPQQFSPIIVEDEYNNLFMHVPFKDKNNKPTFLFEETKISNDQKTFILSYLNIDETSLKIYNNEIEVSNTLYNITDNIIVFNNYVEKNTVYKFSYKIKNSFVTEIDEINDVLKITIYPSNVINKVKVYYETNKDTNKKYINYLSFNTIYTPQNEGFMYIDHLEHSPNKIKIFANPTKIKADNKDIINFYIQLYDKNNNYVQNKTIITSCTNGSIIMANNKTDIYGIVSGSYKTSIKGNDIITAACEEITTSVTITGI